MNLFCYCRIKAINFFFSVLKKINIFKLIVSYNQANIFLKIKLTTNIFFFASTDSSILCGQSVQDGVADESAHFNWHCKIRCKHKKYYNMPLLGEKFPELPQYHFPEQLSLSRDPG